MVSRALTSFALGLALSACDGANTEAPSGATAAQGRLAAKPWHDPTRAARFSSGPLPSQVTFDDVPTLGA